MRQHILIKPIWGWLGHNVQWITIHGLFYLLSCMSLLIWRHLGEWAQNKPRLYIDSTVKIAIILNQNFKDTWLFCAFAIRVLMWCFWLWQHFSVWMNDSVLKGIANEEHCGPTGRPVFLAGDRYGLAQGIGHLLLSVFEVLRWTAKRSPKSPVSIGHIRFGWIYKPSGIKF